MEPFEFLVPTEIHFGAGRIAGLEALAARIGRKPLVVTGRGSARRSGTLDRVLQQLPDAALLEGIHENPGTAQCEEGAVFCRGEGCDSIVALGGGSPVDGAKAIALLATNEGPCTDFFGAEHAPNDPLPLLAIPTTSGAGSETTPYAVLVDETSNTKATIRDDRLFPDIALLDPELTHSLPRDVTINTGLDALSQAMEGLVSKRATPLGDTLALEVCRLVRQWLPNAADEPGHAEARAQMLYASMLSGCVIAQSGTTLVHGMGYAYTLQFGIPHGLANALLLTPLFEHNARALPGKVAQIAGALGHPCVASPDSAERAIGEAIHRLLGDLGVSPAASQAGVRRGALAGLADAVAGEPGRFRNQPGELGRVEVMELYEQSFAGTRSAL